MHLLKGLERWVELKRWVGLDRAWTTKPRLGVLIRHPD